MDIKCFISLNNIKQDAIEKARCQAFTEQVYVAILEIIRLAHLIRKNGILQLQDEMDKIDPALAAYTVLPLGMDYISSGYEEDFLTEVFTSQYMMLNPQGIDALVSYICIRGLLALKEAIPPFQIECILKSILTESSVEEYEKYKESKCPPSKKLSPQEKLKSTAYPKCDDLDTPLDLINIVVNKKLEETPENLIKQYVMQVDNLHFSILFKGAIIEIRNKLATYMTDIRLETILDGMEYMGPVRAQDIEAEMTKLYKALDELA